MFPVLLMLHAWLQLYWHSNEDCFMLYTAFTSHHTFNWVYKTTLKCYRKEKNKNWRNKFTSTLLTYQTTLNTIKSNNIFKIFKLPNFFDNFSFQRKTSSWQQLSFHFICMCLCLCVFVFLFLFFIFFFHSFKTDHPL